MSDTRGGTPMFEQPDFGAAATDDLDDDELESDEPDESAGNGPVAAGPGAGAAGDDGSADDDFDDNDDDDDDDDDGDDDDDDDDDDDEDDSPNRVSERGAARAVLDHVTASLVDDPSSVVIEESEGRSGTRYSVSVASGDMGRVIGRKGRTVQALRTLVRAAAASEGRDASVEVVD